MGYAVRLDIRGCRAVNDASECTTDEYYSEVYIDPIPSTMELFQQLRLIRDNEIDAVIWMAQRHEQQKLLSIDTTLTESQYLELLQYVEQLRNLPSLANAPWDGGGELTPWPVKPSFIKNGV